jgi:hypothetical protein
LTGMKKLILIAYGALGILLAACSPSSTATDNKRYEEYAATAMLFEQHSINEITAAIDKEEASSPNNVQRLSIANVYPDELQLILFHQNGVARKLRFSLFEDDGRRSNEMGTFYFDANGRLIAEKTGPTPSEYFLRYNTFTGEVKAFQKHQDKLFDAPLDTASRLYRHTLTSRYVANYMQFFPGTKFTNIRPIAYSRQADLRTHDSIPLKAIPGVRGSTLEYLPNNTPLVYLGTNGKTDTVENKYWIWYRVLTTAGREGWVFGHPSYVNDLDDETTEAQAPTQD